MKKLLLLLSMMLVMSIGYSQSYTFTPAGANGNTGPTQAELDAAYAGTPLAGKVTSNGGIQYWVVPSTGSYRITALGAQGYGPFGGRGASITGEMILTGGDTIKILVGQEGAPPVGSGTNQYGGGGGSFVTLADNTPLIIAGGGGGSWASSFNSTTDASITNAGNTAANGPTNGAGGVNGLGGAGAASGGGGGGLLGDGGDVSGGKAFINGGNGGIAATNGGQGGFGGGGGASSWDNRRGGGGGGYSGGGGAGSTTTGFPEGGGGGSYNAGMNPVELAGVQLGDGQVIIEVLSSGATDDIGAISIDDPKDFCDGTHNVVATIQNFGVNQVTSATVNWSVNGVVQTPYSFTGTLDTIGGLGSPVAQITLGSITFSGNTLYNTVVWTSSPNGNTDTVSINDSVAVPLKTGLPAPTNLTFYSATSNTATIGWTNPAASNWDLEWGPCGFQQGTGFSASVTTNPYTISNNLNPNTCYDVYVRSTCPGGTGVGSWEGPISFTTLCAPFTGPYYTDFESDPLDVPPTCWNAYVTGTNAWVEVEDLTGTAAPYAGSKALYLYSGSSSAANDTLVAISPQFTDLTSSDKRIRFFANSDGPNSQLIVGTISAVDPNATFNPLDTIVFATPDTYEEVIVNFDAANGYNGTDEFIVLAHSLGATIQYIRIDNFTYETIPACVGSSTTSLSANAGPNDARVYWSGGQGDYTNIIWGTAGFTPGGSGQINMTTVAGTDTSYLITGLSPQTSYTFYVQDTCTVGGLGVYIGPYNFTTACAAISTPHTESFDVNLTIPACWSSYSSTGELWRIGTNTYSPSAEHTGNGGYYANVDDSESPSSPDVTLQSPFFDVSNLTNPELYFFVGSTDATVTLSVDVNDGTTWHNNILVYTSATVNMWDSLSVNLTPFASGGIVAVRFVVDEQNGTFQNDIAIDDITIRSGPSCTAPSLMTVGGLTDSQAILSWFDSPAISYEVWYGPDGFYQGSQTVGGTKMMVSNDSLTLSGLPENTCFEYGIRKICAPGDTSDWVGPIDFCTLCSNQLSGTYTVGGTPGPNNFPNLDTVVQLLNSCGISGPVTINLSGGVHNPFVLLDIIGSSATNTITINGSAAGDSIMGTGGAIELNGADYITFNDLFIKSNAGFTVWMHNDAHHLNFDNCVIESNRTSTASANSVMVASGSNTSQSTAGLNAHHISVTNSTIAGGYYGISIYNESSTVHVNGLTVSNCEFEDIYYYGLRSYYNDSVKILDNHFEPFRGPSGYGMYIYYNDAVEITGNEVEWVGTYSLYAYYTNNGGLGTSVIANNLLNSSGTYGVYMYSPNNLDFFHNTINGGTHGMYLGGSTASVFSNVDFRNNIFTANGTGRALWIATSPLGGFTLDYNLYHNYVGSELAYHNGIAYTSLGAWQTAEPAYNANSVTGDPVYISPSDNLRVLGSAADNVGDNTVGITVDVDGDVRPAAGSTTVDIGADEFTALAGDLNFVGAEFLRNDPCLTTNDTIALHIFNLIGNTIDFAIDPLTINYTVNGPVTTSGSISHNSGTLASQDSLSLQITTIDMSLPGTYTISAYIDPNAVNVLALNDTLNGGVSKDVDSILTVSPKTALIINTTDSVEITAKSPFFPGGDFMITEVAHFKTATGAPAGGWPAYLGADDYIEITGVPGSDLAGITLEQWSTTALMNTFTFPAGTLIGPNGTAIIAVGQATTSTPSPADFYYHGDVSTTFGSSGSNGRILKDASGNIIDAVGYGVYTFPASSGVTAADWTGSTASPISTSGIRLIGADINDAANWVISSASNAQDPNTVNSGVTVPAGGTVSGFQWLLNGSQVTTDPQFHAGPYSSAGTYQYVAELIKCGTTYYDTVTVEVVIPTCPTPTFINATALSATSGSVTFDTAGYAAGTTFLVEYGPQGFALGSGTTVAVTNTNTATLSNMVSNLCVEVYMRAICPVNDTGFAVGPVNLCPEPSLCDDFDSYNPGGILGQSALFEGWYGTTVGAAAASTAQSVSGTQSMYIPGDGISDVVAYYDTIDSGIWNFKFSIFVPTGTEAYYNFQRHYTHGDPTQTNVWAFDVNYLSGGTATIDGGSYGGAGVATFNYTPGQWNLIEHIIDFTNDTAYIMVNGAQTSAGWTYSFNNLSVPVQNNGINFYSNPNLTNPDYYIDDFCIEPYSPSAGCDDPTVLAASNVTCSDAVLSWTSSTSMASSIIVYGPAGFNPATGGTTTTATSGTVSVGSLTPNTAYDFYVADICANGDTSNMVGPVNFTTLGGPITADFTPSYGPATAVNMLVSFDASASVGATSYDWDFGDGGVASTTTPNTSHSYSLNGTYQVCLTITGGCGTDVICDSVTVAGISLTENYLARSLSIYPNPTNNLLNISFDAQGSMEASLRLRDLSGKLIMEMNEKVSGTEFKQTIDISNLAKGVYMLEVVNGDNKAVRRITKN